MSTKFGAHTTSIPAALLTTKVPLPVKYRISHNEAVPVKKIRHDADAGFWLTEVETPAILMLGVQGNAYEEVPFTVTYLAPDHGLEGELQIENIDTSEVLEWLDTSLPDFYEYIFEEAMRESGIERTIGIKLFHRD